MKIDKSMRFLLCLISLISFLAIMGIALRSRSMIPPLDLSALTAWQCYKFVLRKQLEQTHVLVPASHPHFHVRNLAALWRSLKQTNWFRVRRTLGVNG